MQKTLIYLACFGLMLTLGMASLLAGNSQESKSKGKPTPAVGVEKKTVEKEEKGPLTGTWSGTYTRDGSPNTISMDLVHKGNTIIGSLAVDAGTIPIEKGMYDPKEKRLTFEANPSEEEHYTVTAKLNGDTLSGQWKGAGSEGPFSLSRSKPVGGQ